MKRLIILLIMVSAVSFIVRSASSYASSQSFEQWKLFKSSMSFAALEATDKFGSLNTETLKDTALAESKVSNKYLLDAGRNLKIAAGLRYAGFGSALADIALSRYGRSDTELNRGLQYGSAVLFISPYYVGRAGKELAKASLNTQVQEAGRALQKYRSSYYGGLATVVLGTGLSALKIYKGSDPDEPGSIACAVVALGGLLYSALAPPYYLGSAGSCLSKTDIPSGEADPLMHKVGRRLEDAGIYQYISTFAYLLGGIVITSGILENDDVVTIEGTYVLGLGAIFDSISAINISFAGMGLDRASKMQLK